MAFSEQWNVGINKCLFVCCSYRAMETKQQVHFQLHWAGQIPDDIYHVELTIMLYNQKF